MTEWHKRNEHKIISGFSKLSKRGKIIWIVENFFKDPETVMRELVSFWHNNEDQQKVLDGFSENTISNFPLPFSVAPNFMINGKAYCVPMVIEESSVVAAASSSAKFWMTRGGFKATVLDNKKIGQIHLGFKGSKTELSNFFEETREEIVNSLLPITSNMQKRGGGIVSAAFLPFKEESDYCQIRMEFETCDSMGANFINTVLEEYAKAFKKKYDRKYHAGEALEVIMCILSNYTPDCIVRAEVECDVQELEEISSGMKPALFAAKFEQAVKIAHIDPFRATTHNKGIFNGIDSVVIATGNDFRAVEASGHTHAAKSGQYRSLSHCTVKDGRFNFYLEVPLAIGTIGGLTKLHPMAKRSLELLGNPGAEELMEIIASVGLAQNFAALKSLITTGIQKGHMKMHLTNVLNQLQATEREFKMAIEHFSNKIVSYAAVREFIEKVRKINSPEAIKSEIVKKS